MQRKNFSNIFNFFKLIHILILFILCFSSCGYKTDPSYYDNKTSQTQELPFVELE